MGGYGSSRWQYHVSKEIVEFCPQLDAKDVKDSIAAMETGECVGSEMYDPGGFSFNVERNPWGGFFVDVHRTSDSHHPSIGFSQRCLLESTTPFFGSRRWWLRCPSCARRCRILYVPRHGGGFSCRVCVDLAYGSQRMGQEERQRRKIRRLKSQLGAEGDGTAPAAPTPPRAKNMRLKTYARLVEKLQQVELPYWKATWESIQRLKI